MFAPLLLLVASVAPGGMGSSHLDTYRQRMLHFAYQVGGETEAAIIEQESSGCKYRIGDHGRAFGCGQLHLSAAASVLGYTPARDRLIYDDRFNIEVSTKLFGRCLAELRSWPRALLCYHTGQLHRARTMPWRQVLADPYVKAIQRHLNDYRTYM